MLYKKSHPFIAFTTFLLFFVFIIQSSADNLNFSIKGVTPFIILPLLTAYSIFGNVKNCAVIGFITGACADSVASGSHCFNTVALMLIAVLVCLAANNLFNKNIYAACVLSLITATLYFSFHWLIFHALGSTIKEVLEFLLRFSLPAALYTSVFIIPFFYLYKYFDKIKNQ